LLACLLAWKNRNEGSENGDGRRHETRALKLKVAWRTEMGAGIEVVKHLCGDSLEQGKSKQNRPPFNFELNAGPPNIWGPFN